MIRAWVLKRFIGHFYWTQVSYCHFFYLFHQNVELVNDEPQQKEAVNSAVRVRNIVMDDKSSDMSTGRWSLWYVDWKHWKHCHKNFFNIFLFWRILSGKTGYFANFATKLTILTNLRIIALFSAMWHLTIWEKTFISLLTLVLFGSLSHALFLFGSLRRSGTYFYSPFVWVPHCFPFQVVPALNFAGAVHTFQMSVGWKVNIRKSNINPANWNRKNSSIHKGRKVHYVSKVQSQFSKYKQVGGGGPWSMILGYN